MAVPEKPAFDKKLLENIQNDLKALSIEARKRYSHLKEVWILLFICIVLNLGFIIKFKFIYDKLNPCLPYFHSPHDELSNTANHRQTDVLLII